jgi:Tfp pilus assembly protein PilF
LALTLYFLGISYFRLDEFEQAKKRLEEALTIERSVHGEQHPRIVDLYYLGVSYFELKEYLNKL